MVEANVEEPDPIDSLRLLRLGAERRGEETASKRPMKARRSTRTPARPLI